MTQQRLPHKRSWSAILVLLLLAALLYPILAPTAQAGKEGVYLNDSVYFTLEDVQLSPGADRQTLRYTLELVNGSEQSVDYNKYGAAVLDGSGNRYSSELAEKINSRVKPGKTLRLNQVSKIPQGISLEDLQIQIFAWDFDAPDYIRPLGTLSVASVESATHTDKPQTVLNLTDADGTFPGDSLAAFQLDQSYKVLTDGTWNVYLQLTVENLGSSSFKLPSALQFLLKDVEGQSYPGTAVYGGDRLVLPRQSQPLTLQFPVGGLENTDGLTLELFKKQSASTGNSSNNAQSGGGQNGVNSQQSATPASGTASTLTTVLGSLNLSGTWMSAGVKEEKPISGRQDQLSGVVDTVSVYRKSDGIHAESKFVLKNAGKAAAAVPVLGGIYQINGTVLSVNADDSLSHPAFLGPGGTTEYRFKAVLPDGVDPSLVQLTVTEKKGTGTGVQVPVYLAALPADANSGTSSSSSEEGTGVYYTPAGKLAMSLKQTYRLMTENGDDLLISEIQVENLETHTVTLPSLVAGYSDGNVELPGKAIRVQTSAYLSAGQKTTLYLAANVPAGGKLENGSVYFGEGTLDSKTNELSISKEWAAFSFQEKETEMPETAANQDWFVSAAGAQSTGRVIDRQIYDLNGDKILAVRIASKNQESRSTKPLPYTGYFVDGDQRVWKASETLDTSRGGKDSWSMSTLWTKLPSGQQDMTKLVFGPKLEDTVFASPRQYGIGTIEDKPLEFNLKDKSTFTADLLPYHLTFKDLSRTIQNNSYILSFKYELKKDLELTPGSNANRTLFVSIEDDSENVYKTWDIPLDGSGSLKSGESNELTITNMTVNNMLELLIHGKIKFYEKFEGGTRLLATVTATNS